MQSMKRPAERGAGIAPGRLRARAACSCASSSAASSVWSAATGRDQPEDRRRGPVVAGVDEARSAWAAQGSMGASSARSIWRKRRRDSQ